MTKLLHTNTKIFFSNPHVVRVDYKDGSYDKWQMDHRQLTRKAYKSIFGTWGHSPIQYEYAKIKNDYPGQPPPGPNYYDNLSVTQVASSLMNPDWIQIGRGYFVFKDQLDTLQFKLSVDPNAITVKMWPDVLFTIHETVDYTT